MLKPHDHVLDLVDDYLHELLSPFEEEAVERHCQKCKICGAALEEAHRRAEAFAALPPVEASEQLTRRTVDQVGARSEKRSKFWRRYTRFSALAAALAVLIIGGTNVYFYRMAPSPYDLRVLGQDKWLGGAGASLRVELFHAATGEAIANAPVEMTLHNPHTKEVFRLASFTTGAGKRGLQYLTPPWPPGSYTLNVSAQPPTGPPETLNMTVDLTRSWKLMLSPDKPVYQPGQTIRLRALALRRPDLRPIAGEKAVFTITDPKQNIIFKSRDVTSKFGIVSAECPLATEIIEGAYQIDCRLGDTASERTVEVRKYVLPKFKVALQTDKPFYQPGEEVRVNVRADYFFGKPVTQGEVELEAQGQDAASFKIAAIKDTTNEQGKASLTFRLPEQFVGRPQDDGNAAFQIAVTVADAAGQTHSAGLTRMVTRHPIQLTIVPESGSLVQDQVNRVYVFAAYADGRPAKTRLAVQGLPRELTTDQRGFAVFELTPRQSNVQLTFRATDADGLIGRKSVWLSATGGGDFLLRTDKAVYQGGDTMTVQVLGGGKEPVFLDLIQNDQTVLTQTIEMEAGKGNVQVDLPPELFGVVRLTAYRFGRPAISIRKSRMVLVIQARGLKIDVNTAASSHRPGETAKLKITLTDENGRPQAGAVSLAAVDEAVYSVLNQRAGLEPTFMMLERELLQPIYAIYDQWMPRGSDAVSEENREKLDEFERALFSITATAPRIGDGALPSAFVGDKDPSVSAFAEIQRDLLQARESSPSSSASSVNVDPFTLSAASFPSKKLAVEGLRDFGLTAVVFAWIGLAVLTVLAGLVAFALFHPQGFFWTMAASGFLLAGVVIWGVLGTRTSSSVFNDIATDLNNARTGSIDVMRGASGNLHEEWELLVDSSKNMRDLYGVDPAQGAAPPRVRKWFPETLLWLPELVTDDNGVAEYEVKLADSITTWRLSASAVTAEGRFGGQNTPIKVFQPFFVDLNLPVALTRNDEVSVPIVVYNYLDQTQKVELAVEAADWFERIGQKEDEKTNQPLTVELPPRAVKSVLLPIQVRQVGLHNLQITASAGGVADAVRREIEVVADGKRVEQVAGGVLDPSAEMALDVPEDAIEGSVRAIVKLYPSNFSQLVEGLENIFHMPSGCFEQTSSTTYPNVLALDYLRRNKKAAPAVEARARQYVHVGYQRLLTFEVSGGGFDWYGQPPANLSLTAYGLMEFQDMAHVYDVDPRLIRRTRDWLLSRRNSLGFWPGDERSFHGFDGVAQHRTLALTAYIGWAVFGNQRDSTLAEPTLDYLLSHRAETIDDPYVLALTARAIAAIRPDHPALNRYLTQLANLKQTDPADASGKRVFWRQSKNQRTMFFGAGPSGDVETTAMAALAMISAGRHPGLVRAALNWLVEQKDAHGTWRSTQATVLALKALLAGSRRPLGDEQPREISIALDGETVKTIKIPPDQAEVMRQVDLSSRLSAGGHRLSLTDRTGAGTTYQITFRYHADRFTDSAEKKNPPLSIDLTYDRKQLPVNEHVVAAATVTNHMAKTAPMVILDLPIPAGFELAAGELEKLQKSGKIAKYQITARKAIIYLRQLDAGQSIKLHYRLRATMPIKVNVPAGQAYEYYDPQTRGVSKTARLTAIEG